MQMAFDEVKATQIAAYLLNLAGGRLNYMALIKLLYKIDREALRRWGVPVTTDRYVSMKYGPVTSRIYNRVKEGSNPNVRPSYWSAHIGRTSANTVVLQRNPGDSELSPAEENLAAEVFKSDGAKDRFLLAEECHRDFPEWKDPGETSIPITIEEILAALGKTEEEVAFTESAIGLQNAVQSLLKA